MKFLFFQWCGGRVLMTCINYVITLGQQQIWEHKAITLRGHMRQPEGIKVLELNTFSSTSDTD